MQKRTEANGHDHPENTLGLYRRLPDGDRDLVCFICADGAPARPLRPPTRRLWLWPSTRPLWPPAKPLWPSVGRLWPTTGDLCPAEPVCTAAGWTPGDNQR